MGIFANQTLSAKSWHQTDNSAIEKIFADMIESIVLEKTSLNRALNEAADKVTILMKK